ncbi:50S ribosomal protein L9 [Owenweeksia hongkongensis]|uniref:Large ribosomal subunit protein bL9 n=1 Tax=Owenweeksia hongkongensis (strain DSM 17368 / CIP 108786 / JCM 12287 / NRRL B-23963 / UST20020801) TaxID=926562 RepID=G8R0B8_OWEHD|nr:50S ribosomal protein L9 [Owenweeksia hongkongensis]AEV31578.1 ribosomal protein L9 [Owenweeksia hongkongensis DSM 17368]
MELILKQDVENLGYKDDIVEVRPGYGRNFLIPSGVAVQATPGAKKMLAENIKQRKHKEAKEIEEAQKVAAQLNDQKMKITTKVGKGNKLFGSINNANLADELSKMGHHIDRKYIQIQGGTVKATGPYQAKIRLHREVVVDFDFEVVGEA